MLQTPDRASALFGANLREARLKAGLTISQLADVTGVSKSFIGRIERGDKNVSLDIAECLAQAVNRSLRTLLTAPKPHDT